MRRLKYYLVSFLMANISFCSGCLYNERENYGVEYFAMLLDAGDYRLVKLKADFSDFYIKHCGYIVDAISDENLGVVGFYDDIDVHNYIGFEQLVFLEDFIDVDTLSDDEINFLGSRDTLRNNYLDRVVKYDVDYFLGEDSGYSHMKYYTLRNLDSDDVSYGIGYDLDWKEHTCNTVGVFDINTFDNYLCEEYEISSEDVFIDKKSLSRCECSKLLNEYKKEKEESKTKILVR